jgi:hypothetical protein
MDLQQNPLRVAGHLSQNGCSGERPAKGPHLLLTRNDPQAPMAWGFVVSGSLVWRLEQLI